MKEVQPNIAQLKEWGFQAKPEWYAVSGKENRAKPALKPAEVVYQRPRGMVRTDALKRKEGR